MRIQRLPSKQNRPHENVETGILLTITIVFIGYYYKTILQVFQH
ncbi:MAG TPA: hypothetical protein VGB95_05215 [Chitinophagales bacterium]